MTTSLSLAVVLVLAAGVAEAFQPNCTKCLDGTECCSPDALCCATGPQSYMCCENDNVCCDGICCSAQETCCKGTCCIEQTTFCCPKDEYHPDRCCPRWTVCCTVGERFGCCDPAMLGNTSNIAYGIFVEVARVWALTLDFTTGKIIRQVPVHGFDNWGEITRVFAFDARRVLFYYLEANFTMPRPATGRLLTLYTVDPTTGIATSAIVQGAVDFPAGYAFDDASESIILATTIGDPAGQGPGPSGFNFYSLNPTNAVARKISAAPVSGDFAYSGYFHDYAGGSVFRLGFRDPQQGTDQGLGVTNITGPNATTTWSTAVPLLPIHDFYVSLTPYNGSFISLAPRKANAALDLALWSTSGAVSVLGSLDDAHEVPFFGPLSETINAARGLYIAGVVHNGAGVAKDRWGLAVADLVRRNVTSLELEPRLIAEIDSIAGIGIPHL